MGRLVGVGRLRGGGVTAWKLAKMLLCKCDCSRYKYLLWGCPFVLALFALFVQLVKGVMKWRGGGGGWTRGVAHRYTHVARNVCNGGN